MDAGDDKDLEGTVGVVEVDMEPYNVVLRIFKISVAPTGKTYRQS